MLLWILHYLPVSEPGQPELDPAGQLLLRAGWISRMLLKRAAPPGLNAAHTCSRSEPTPSGRRAAHPASNPVCRRSSLTHHRRSHTCGKLRVHGRKLRVHGRVGSCVGGLQGTAVSWPRRRWRGTRQRRCVGRVGGGNARRKAVSERWAVSSGDTRQWRQKAVGTQGSA